MHRVSTTTMPVHRIHSIPRECRDAFMWLISTCKELGIEACEISFTADDEVPQPFHAPCTSRIIVPLHDRRADSSGRKELCVSVITNASSSSRRRMAQCRST